MSESAQKISFAKVPGAGASAPVEPAKTVTPDVVPPEAGDENVPTPPSQSAALAERKAGGITFYTGENEDEHQEEETRIKYPYLNLVQPSSKADMKALGAEGDFVFNRQIKLPHPAIIVVIGFSKIFYREKVKFGGENQGRLATSLEMVAQMGGTTQWRQSKENDKIDSRKPWFMPSTKALVLVQQPEGADEGLFPHEADGKLYGMAVIELKSTAFDSFYTEIESKRQTTALFRGGYSTRFIKLESARAGKAADASFKPIPLIGDKTPESVQTLAKRVVS